MTSVDSCQYLLLQIWLDKKRKMDSIYNILECSVCFESLDATSRILPCQHTFCMRCLKTILSTQHQLRCPECRAPVPVRDVTELPTNILLVRILDGLNKPSGPGPPHLRLTGNSSTSSDRSCPVDQTVGRTSSSTAPKQSPCAQALYKYDTQEASDLSFNKGDIIILKKKIDDNWYQGECNNQLGFFPANYVRVIHPLPTELPQCKALYDFDVSANDERDVLKFSKDEIFKVIRRVDENWVEGQKGDKIGIFPLSFVELNDPAKVLLDGHGSNHDSPRQRHSPQSSVTASDQGSDQSQNGAAAVTIREGPRNKSSAKRHSFTSVLGVQLRAKENIDKGNNSNRHSMEISSPELVRSSNPLAATLLEVRQSSGGASTSPTPTSPPAAGGPTSQPSAVNGHRRKPPPLTVINQTNGISNPPGSPTVFVSLQPPGTPTYSNSDISHSPRPSSSPRPVIEVFQSKYAYQPQNPDELEMKPGEFFTVHDICTDGWFKGMSLWTGQVGVFPGNYMQPYNIHDVPRNSGSPTLFPIPTSSKVITSSSPATSVTSSHPVASSPAQVVRPRATTPHVTANTTLTVSNSTSTAGAFSRHMSFLQQERQKTVAQLQSERIHQQMILRGLTGKINGQTGSTSQEGSPPPLIANHVSHTEGSHSRNVPLRSHSNSPGGLRNQSKARPLSGTGIPVSAVEQMLHVTAAAGGTNSFMQNKTTPENMSHASRSSAMRQGARGRSKSASRLSTKGMFSSSNSKNERTSPENVPRPTWHTQDDIAPKPKVCRQHSVPSSLIIHPPSNVSYSPAQSPKKTIFDSLDYLRPRRYSEGESEAKRFRSFLRRPTLSSNPPTSACPGSPTLRVSGPTSPRGANSCSHARGVCVQSSHAVFSSTSSITTSASTQTSHRVEKKEKKDRQRRRTTSNTFNLDQLTAAQPPSPPVRTTPPLINQSRSSPSPDSGASGGSDGTSGDSHEERPPKTIPLVRERYSVIVPYPAQSDFELDLVPGEVVFVHKKREDGWFKGTLQRTGKTGMFPGIFVEKL